MPVLLIINRDDSYLPRGWVTAILPDNSAMSGYEKSGELFAAVTVPDGPALAKQKAAGAPMFSARTLIYDRGQLQEVGQPAEVVRKRIATLGAALKSVRGPAVLDRSHSTIWDYGPGRTYSTPQSAFDALVAQAGANPFAEVHYVRGFGGNYGQGASGCVLCLSIVEPSARFPLVIDADAGAEVVWDGEGGDACLLSSGVSHVRARDLKVRNASGGIAPSDWTANTSDWLVERVEAGSPDSDMQIGVCTYMTDRLRVRHCDLHHLAICGVGCFPGFAGTQPAFIEVSGTRISDCEQGFYNEMNATWLLANITIHAVTSGIRHSGAKPLTLAALINNVFAAAGPDFISIRVSGLALDDLSVLRSDGNRFHPALDGTVASLPDNDLDLNAWREWFGCDARSIISDPQLDSELAPLPQSPCLGAGVCLDDAGASGQTRAESVDMGHEQITAVVPTIIARREPEIARRK